MRPMGDEQRRELEREVVAALRQREEPLGGSELLTVVDASEPELRFAVSELLDKHRITITEDWEYELDG